MRPLISLAALLTCALAACSPGDGRDAGAPETKTYPISDFTNLKAETGVTVILKQGPYAVEATSQNGDLSRLSVTQKDFTLEVGSSGMFTIGRAPNYTVTLTAPEWRAIDVSAGAQVKGEALTLTAISIDASTGGAVDISGACTTLEADAATGGSITVSNLICATVTADALAGGMISAHATTQATATATAGGMITLAGNPPTVSKTATAGGTITP